MTTDPNTKRARDVVWLVVFTVALPSVLLTALGAVAVENEEAAAKERLTALYQPTLRQVANAYNGTMDDVVAASAIPLRALLTAAQSDPDATSPPELRQFRGRYDFSTSFFVVGEDGALLVPRIRPLAALEPRHDAASALPTELVSAIGAQEHSDVQPACSKLEAMAESAPDPAHACAMRFAAASCRVARGDLSPNEAASRLCEAYVEHPATDAALRLRALGRSSRSASPAERAHDDDPPETQTRREVERARRALFEALSDPMLPAPAFFIETLARDALITIQPEQQPEYPRWRVAFYTLARRPAFLAEVAAAIHPRDAPTRMTTLKSDNWRRVHVQRSIAGMTAGFEMIPTLIEPFLQTALATLGLDDELRAILHSVDLPTDAFPDCPECRVQKKRITNFAFSKKADLSWQIALALRPDSAFLGLDRSRSTLYFWALVLMASALIFGLVYTVWAVIREARLSRLKTDFVSSVSHDLRTPLTSIRMFTEMLLMGRVHNKDDERECLEVIAKETERLTRLTERILDFSRMEAGRKAYSYAPIDVEAVMNEALEACRPLMTEGEFEVSVEVEPGMPRMRADRDAMVEVLMNLISNAVKYSPEERFLALRARRRGDSIALSVADHGMGIPKSETRRIFEKFHRVDCRRTSEVSGSGIGLSLVEHIVRAHEGKIEVQSTPGRGSTFTVMIPAEGAREGASMTEATDGANTGYRGRPVDSPGAV